MYAATRYGTPSLTSLPKDGGVSCSGRLTGKSPIQINSFRVTTSHRTRRKGEGKREKESKRTAKYRRLGRKRNIDEEITIPGLKFL